MLISFAFFRCFKLASLACGIIWFTRSPPLSPLSSPLLDCSFWHYSSRLPVYPQVKFEVGMKCKRGGPCHIRSVCMGLSASTAVIIVGENNSCTECPGKQEGSISEKEQYQSWIMKVFSAEVEIWVGFMWGTIAFRSLPILLLYLDRFGLH